MGCFSRSLSLWSFLNWVPLDAQFSVCKEWSWSPAVLLFGPIPVSSPFPMVGSSDQKRGCTISPSIPSGALGTAWGSPLSCLPVPVPQPFFLYACALHFRGVCHREVVRIFYNCYYEISRDSGQREHLFSLQSYMESAFQSSMLIVSCLWWHSQSPHDPAMYDPIPCILLCLCTTLPHLVI